MSHLPASIEAYLEEAGFSATEMLIVRQLLDHGATTLREIAVKTGKSTGMLDQAMRKLLQKKIVGKETINDVPKYVLNSLQSIVECVEREIKEKQKEVERRKKNFESFMATLTVDKNRPDMQYFEGEKALQNGYIKLLEIAGKEMLHYFPVTTTAEADPLRAFRVEYFRERRRRGIFARYVIHNTPLGRRFQSRDPFEYRQSVLVEERQYPFTFERIIAGDTIACFHHKEQQVCFIRFPAFTASDRAMFEKLWQKKIAPKQVSSGEALAPEPTRSVSTDVSLARSLASQPIPMQTRTLSALRDFFLSRRSLAILAVFGIAAGLLTYSFYRSNVNLNTQRIRERALAIAATGALQFDPADLNELRTPADIVKPQYQKVIYKLNEIRRQNEDVKYIYIMRPTEDPNVLEFVADADSLDPYAKKDLNGDGVIDEADWLRPPGEPYDITGYGPVHDLFALKKPTVDQEPFTDQWGTFLSGHAPTIDAQGNVAAMLGVDIFADKVQELTQRTFTPFLWFIGIFLFFVLIRLAAFNRSLLQELWELLQMRKAMIIMGLAAFVSIAITFGLYTYTQQITFRRMQDKVMAIATTAASQFDAKDLEALQVEEDWKKPEWAKVVNKLKKIRTDNPDVTFVYMFRKTDSDPKSAVFVSDSHSLNPYANTDSDPTNDVDANNDGKMEPQGPDLLQWQGQAYESGPSESFDAYNGPTATNSFYKDIWGNFVSGYAPIKDQNGNVVAILAIDLSKALQLSLTNEVFAPIYVFIVFFVLFILFRAPGFTKSLLHQLLKLLRTKKILIILGTSAVISFIVTYGMYQYTLKIMKAEIGQRLMSIAATAAPEIDGEDLEKIHTDEDMKTEEYQRVFRKLNEIRERNKKIKYIYTFRQSSDPEQWEFVVDSDSNYFIPHLEWDYNNDGKLDAADENVTPGTQYDIKKYAPEIYLEGYIKPVITKEMATDQWGTFLTATAPIRKNDGIAVAVLGVDIEASDVYELTKEKFSSGFWFSIIFSGVLGILMASV